MATDSNLNVASRYPPSDQLLNMSSKSFLLSTYDKFTELFSFKLSRVIRAFCYDSGAKRVESIKLGRDCLYGLRIRFERSNFAFSSDEHYLTTGFALEKLAAMQEHGTKVFFTGTWVSLVVHI